MSLSCKVIFAVTLCVTFQKSTIAKHMRERQIIAKDDVEELISSAGYTSESYEVETEDHYLLKLHRIRAKYVAATTKPLGPVFFMHGLFATASDTIMTGANIALPYLLSNNGYDCWLGNSRGSDHSLMHKTLNVHSKEYWNFSFHEIGYYDVPTMFDFMLSHTNTSRAFYVGHSQGGTSLMVLLTLRPEFNDKIIHAHLMAPAVFMKNFPHPFIRFFASELNAFIDKYQYYDFLSSTQLMNFIEPVNSFVCQRNSPIIGMCTNILSMICGRNDNVTETDSKILPGLIKHLSHAASTKQFHHFIQLYNSGKFQQYDYKTNNKFVYHKSSPPEYDLTKATTSIYLYSGKNDMLVAEKDIEKLKEILPNVRKYRSIKNYNHCDFNYGANSRKAVFNSILKSLGHN